MAVRRFHCVAATCPQRIFCERVRRDVLALLREGSWDVVVSEVLAHPECCGVYLKQIGSWLALSCHSADGHDGVRVVRW